MKHIILMADIIKSRNGEPKKLMAHFKKLVSEINISKRKGIVSPLTITLGDEFQGIVKNIETGVEIIFKIEELIIKECLELKLRYILHSGQIDTTINKKVAYEMLGPGLTAARSLLMNLKRDSARFTINTDHKIDSYINKSLFLYQSIVDSWKKKDLKIVANFLEFGDYKTVAEHANVDISSAWRRKKSLKITEYLYAKELILYLITDF